MILVRDAQAVRTEGSVVVYRGLGDEDSGYGTVWFGVDHSIARGLPEVLDALVEEWQILATTAPFSSRRDPDAFVGPDEPTDDEDRHLHAMEASYERHIGRT